jgi:hypothetical protein
MSRKLSDPCVRDVLQDEAEETGLPVGWGKFARFASHNADDAADADADDNADDAADAADDDAADADDADDNADDAADADDADDNDADDDAADAAADAADDNNNHHWRTHAMREGLLLIQVPGRYWGVTRVGWARHVEGDEWELHGAVTLVRKSGSRKLAQLAEDGPQQDHNVSEPARLPELLHRWSARRVLVADVKAWAKHCPKPEDTP